MLNYVWISMIAIAIVVGVGKDVSNEIANPCRNGRALEVRLDLRRQLDDERTRWEGDLVVGGEIFGTFYGVTAPGPVVRQSVQVTVREGKGTLLLTPGETSSGLWKTMAASGTIKGKLSGTLTNIQVVDGIPTGGSVEFESIRFVKLRAITQAALDFANTAVDISLGLIGIMALWLGLIKVAEEAGLVALLTRALRPLTRRLFPDVPHDHPAVGAMIMNIAANMLGLNNAATPMGLKAMEELNKINPKIGTATNAMCTFLVINTSGLTLIPATAIAVRAAAGSANPGIIIGTSIIGAGCATVAGLIAVKLLQRLPMYRVEGGKGHD